MAIREDQDSLLILTEQAGAVGNVRENQIAELILTPQAGSIVGHVVQDQDCLLLLVATPIVCTAFAQLKNGNFQNAMGTPLANGTLRLKINTDAQIAGATCTGQVCGGVSISYALDGSGNILGTPFVLRTDYLYTGGGIAPSYTAYVYAEDGQLAWGPSQQTIAGSSVYDLDTWTPQPW